MLKRIRRHLLFLCVFTFAATNIADLGIYTDGEALEAASAGLPLPEEDKTESGSTDGLAEQLEQEQPEEQEHMYGICSPVQEESLWDTSLKTVSDYIHTYDGLMYYTKDH